MLNVLRVHLPSDIPIAGCELSPYVLLRKPDGSITTDDVPEGSPVDGFFIRYRWFRGQGDKRNPVCSVHVSEPATIQCIQCLKAKLPVARSYHCSPQCFQAAWPRHRAWHSRGLDDAKGKDGEEPAADSRANGAAEASSTALANGLLATSGAGYNSNSSNGSSNNGSGWMGRVAGGQRGRSTPPPPHPEMGGEGPIAGTNGAAGNETWVEVGRGRSYTPCTDDVGHGLKLECVAVESATGTPVIAPFTILTSRVIPAPSPTPRRMVPAGDAELGAPSAAGGANGTSAGGSSAGGTFSLLTYNVLADLFATSEMYSYCPPWALSWAYRKQNLLRELLGYKADIMCLQEVQSDHYDEFFGPELEKHGYASVYKKKTTEVYTGSYVIDGCATFYRRDRFSLVKKYEVEFNKAALSLSEALPPPTKKAALNRLLKDNVALIVVLEAREQPYGDGAKDTPPSGKRQLLCVANTHIHANPELKDVKLWQVHTLLKGLEKIAASADIPMLVAGDFNSVPGSAPHSLLALGRVDASHPELATDPLGILRPASKLCHQLPLVSAYSMPGSRGAQSLYERQQQQQQRRMDGAHREPLFTNCTRDFLGTLDYIFFTADSLQVESLLELLDEDMLRKDTALPSPEWSSDHLALLAEFRYKPKVRR